MESDEQAWQVPPLQTGVSPPQSEPERHCTQVLVVVHRGVAGGQFASTRQRTHSPLLGPDEAHSGVGALQSALLVQARQVRAELSQIGFWPLQFAFVKHPTHVLVGTSQRGVAPVHSVEFVAEQTAQMPETAQAGVAPPQAGSPSHAHGVPEVLSSSS